MKLYLQTRVPDIDSRVEERKEPTQHLLELVHERRIALFNLETSGTPAKTTVKLAKVSQGGTADKREYSVTWVSIAEKEQKEILDEVDELTKPKEPAEEKDAKK